MITQHLNQNKYVHEVQRLRNRENRDQSGLVIVEGYLEVQRALKCNIPIKTLFICKEIFQDEHQEFKECNIVEVSKDIFKQMAFGARLKGILAICQPPILSLRELKLKKNPLIIIMVDVEKPGNLGAILRSCDGASVDAVIVSESKTDIYNHNVVRSSIGTVFSVPTLSASFEDIHDFCEKQNIHIYAMSSKAEENYTLCDLKASVAICIGNEHTGLSESWLKRADSMLKIPMKGDASCLNAAASGAIIVYEALRQRS